MKFIGTVIAAMCSCLFSTLIPFLFFSKSPSQEQTCFPKKVSTTFAKCKQKHCALICYALKLHIAVRLVQGQHGSSCLCLNVNAPCSSWFLDSSCLDLRSCSSCIDGYRPSCFHMFCVLWMLPYLSASASRTSPLLLFIYF